MSDPRYAQIGEPAEKLIEECAELIKALCKARRFGWLNHHPEKPLSLTNLQEVLLEIQDVRLRMSEVESLVGIDPCCSCGAQDGDPDLKGRDA